MDDVGTEKDTKTYELALLLKSEDDAARMMELVRQHSGEVVAEPRAKKIALAYKIKENTEAVFVSCVFAARGEDAKNLERDLRTQPDVIRSMIIVASPLAVRREPTAMPSFPFHAPKYGRVSPEPKPSAPRPLSNEALEKKIEEILG